MYIRYVIDDLAINKEMRNFVALLALLIVFVCHNVHAQSVVYTYNGQGGCTSRVVKRASSKAKKKMETAMAFEANSAKANVSPVTSFKEQIAISATGLSEGQRLSYRLSNIAGQVFFCGNMDNGKTVLPTKGLPNGLYILKLSGIGCAESYKMTKK